MNKRILAHIAGLLLVCAFPRSGLCLSYVLRPSPGIITTLTTNKDFAADFEPAPSFEYFAPSVISLAGIVTIPEIAPKPGLSGRFPGLADVFTFRFGPGDGAGGFADGSDTLALAYAITGTVGYSATGIPFSTGQFTGASLKSLSGDNAGAFGVLDTDPINGLPAIRIKLSYEATPVTLFVDKLTPVPAPGASFLSVSGFVADVPEPCEGVVFVVGCLLTGVYYAKSRP
jgi:hypothetical protein